MESIQLGGRTWRIIQQGTLEHLIWMDRQVLEAGLPALFEQRSAIPSASEFAAKVWERISKSDQALALLGGMLCPEEISDGDWTPQLAEQTVAFLKKLAAPEDLGRVRSLLVSVVMGFFGAVRAFSALSGIASESLGGGIMAAPRPPI